MGWILRQAIDSEIFRQSFVASTQLIALKCFKGFEIDFWTRGGTLSGHVDSGDGPYVGPPGMDLTWHKHYKTPRPKI